MSKPTCFIIMPLTTPAHYVDQYKGDKSHFIHVLDHLFKPAITAAGLDPIPPISKGSLVIHGDIIKNIETADLVLCDMSILNPNVFFELGIRTALNKSVAMVKDDVTPKIPFDTGIINHHTYKCSLDQWDSKSEIESLKTHLEDCMENGSDNALWGYFSMSQQAEVPNDAPDTDKQLSYLIKQVDSLRSQINPANNNILSTTKNAILEAPLPKLRFQLKQIFENYGIKPSIRSLSLAPDGLEICIREELPLKVKEHLMDWGILNGIPKIEFLVD